MTETKPYSFYRNIGIAHVSLFLLLSITLVLGALGWVQRSRDAAQDRREERARIQQEERAWAIPAREQRLQLEHRIEMLEQEITWLQQQDVNIRANASDISRDVRALIADPETIRCPRQPARSRPTRDESGACICPGDPPTPTP